MDRLAAAVAGLPADCSGPALVDRLSDTAPTVFQDGGFRPNSAGVVYCDSHREVTVISDAWVAVDGAATFYGHQLETSLARLRAAFTELALKGESTRISKSANSRRAVE